MRRASAYANRVRSETIASNHSVVHEPEGIEEAPPQRRALRKRWAELVYRIYAVDPLTCPRCGRKMKLLAFIIDPAVIRRILDHLEHKAPPRAPPEPSVLTVL